MKEALLDVEIPDQDMILLLEEPNCTSIVKLIVSGSSTQRFNESSIAEALVTS